MRAATVYNFLVEATLTASVAILLLLLIRRFLRRPLGNRALLFAWLLIAIRLLCPLALPNPVFDDVPRGGEDDFTVVSVHGTPRDFEAEGFTPRDHLDLGER